MAQQLRILEDTGSIPGLTQWVKAVTMSCGVGRRCGSDPALLWLWHRQAAVAPIGPLAWEPPYAAGVALKEQKKKKKEKKRKKLLATPILMAVSSQGHP